MRNVVSQGVGSLKFVIIVTVSPQRNLYAMKKTF